MTDKEQILEVEERLMSAIKLRQVDLLKELVHDNLVFIDRNGQIIKCSKELETYRAGQLDFELIDICDMQINLTGNTAMVLATERITGIHNGQPFEGRYSCLRIWKRMQLVWKITAASGDVVRVREFQ